jgi:uncharacterized protein YndB with AHSA1/START domain
VIDVVHQISAVERRVGTRVLEPGKARTVTVSQAYDADLDDLWDACTNPERIPRWFLPVTGELEVGGRYELEGNASGVIEACDPPRGFDATWEFGGQTSWIEVRLTAEPGGRSRLTLDHIAHVDDEIWNQFGPGAVGIGWDLALVGLALHLAGGVPVDHDEVEAWSASEDGRRFVALSSDAWCDAAVAGGAAPSDARGAADRTTAFYAPDPEAPEPADESADEPDPPGPADERL